jgi:hypothetical protein
MGWDSKRFLALIGLIFIFAVSAAGTKSWAATTPTPPVVKLVGPSPLTEHLNSVRGGFTVSFNLNVENDGGRIAPPGTGKNAGGYKVGVVSDRNYLKAGQAPTITADGSVAIAATTVTKIPVTLTVRDKETTSLTVTLTVLSPAGVAPSTQDITLTRSPRSLNFVGILLGSLGTGSAVALLMWIRRDKRAFGRNLIFTDSTFSFSQSWATSVSGILTIVATVFTSTGVLGDLVPGIDTGFFLTVTIVYGVVLALAPLMYLTLQQPDGNHHIYGTRQGYAVAAVITLVAVGGQLSTLGAIIWLSDLNRPLRAVLLVFLGAVAAAVVWYTEATRRQLWQLVPSPAPAPGSAPATAALP